MPGFPAGEDRVRRTRAGQGICSDKIDLGARTYTGIDLSPILIDRAERLYNAENRHFLTGSIYDLPFADNSFDAVFSVNLWHLMADLRKASAEWRTCFIRA